MKLLKKRRLKAALDAALPEYGADVRLGAELGSGVTSVVYELPATGEALKVMDTRCDTERDSNSTSDTVSRKRMWECFQNEIAFMRLLQDCAYVVDCSDSYEYIFPAEKRLARRDRLFRSLFFIRMPKLIRLDKYVDKHPTEKVLIRMAKDICKALQYCEERNILHLDIKPENIFVDTSMEQPRFLLGDLGFCQQVDPFSLKPITPSGYSKEFRAPELEKRKPLAGRLNSDLYSLGVSLFYLVTNGKFPSNYMERDEKLKRLSNISPEFANIILKAVQPEPEERYQSALETLCELRALNTPGTESVVENSSFLQVKQFILDGDFDAAIEIAKIGKKEGNRDCKRLLAYCYYEQYRKNECSEEPSAVLRRVRRILDELTYEGSDPVAQCLRAIVHYNDHEFAAFAKNLVPSAEAGCVIAQYLYGRLLLKEDKNVPQIARNALVGQQYLLRAAEEGYLDALRFLAAHHELLSSASPLLRKAVLDDRRLRNYQKYIREDIVRFL